MARKKQTTTKSRRKQKDVLKLTAECPVCKWTTRSTPENARCQWLLHLLHVHDITLVPPVEDSKDKAACQPTHQVHEPAPVRQVEDSEEEAACQPSQQIHDLTPVHQVEDSENEAACQPIQQVHGPAPVRQVEDSEDEAVHQPIQHGSVV